MNLWTFALIVLAIWLVVSILAALYWRALIRRNGDDR